MRNIMKAAAALALAGGAMAAAPKPAAAQLGSIIPIRVKAGIFTPQDKDTRNAAGSTVFNAEIDLTVPSPGAGQTIFTAGYAEGSKSGRRFRMIPLTVSQVFSPPNPAAGLTGNVYFGVGAGVYLLRASGGGGTATGSREKTTFGGFAVVGYLFPQTYFIEGKYHVAGDVDGLSPNGLAILLGRRF